MDNDVKLMMKHASEWVRTSYMIECILGQIAHSNILVGNYECVQINLNQVDYD